jgi:hypothetical protein
LSRAVVTISRFEMGEQGIIMAWAGRNKGTTGRARIIIMALAAQWRRRVQSAASERADLEPREVTGCGYPEAGHLGACRACPRFAPAAKPFNGKMQLKTSRPHNFVFFNST